MIEVRFFAYLRERLETDCEVVAADGINCVGDLQALLSQRGGVWQELLAPQAMVKTAVNQTLANAHTKVSDGDEVAFFPPVTGG